MIKTHGIKNTYLHKFLYLLVFQLFISLGIFPVYGQAKSNSSLKPVPAIRTVGILPLPPFPKELNLKRAELFSMFDTAVKDSQRFRTISSSLVEAMYEKSGDREQLVSQFEIDSFLKLRIFNSKNKDIIFEISLTDAGLNPLMFEQDSYTLNYLNSISSKLLEDKIKSLVYRFINRLPYDTLITSVQGDYLTVDAGSNQEIKKGDVVEFVKTFVEEIHPLTNTWVKFKSVPIGNGIVEEVKNKVSIVKVLTHNTNLQINDGVLLDSTISRKKFELLSSTSFKDTDKHSIIYPQDVPEPNSKELEEKVPETKEPEPIKDTLPKKVDNVKKDDGYPLKELFNSLFNLATLEVGINAWQFEKVSAKVPSGFLINNFLIHTGKYIEDSVGYDINFDFGFGPTKHGNYWGASADSDVFWLKSLKDMSFLSNLKVGLGVKSDNLSVSREIFGGWNDFYFRFLLGTENDIDIFSGERLNWSVNMYIVPAVLGTVGYNNNKRTIQSSNGLFLEALFILLGNEDAFEYGLSWRMGFMNMETKDYDLKYTMFRLSFCARRTF